MTAGLLIARALTDSAPHTQRPLHVLPESTHSISVEATPHTTIPGTWGVWLAGGGHLRVTGTPLRVGTRVVWSLDEGQEPLAHPDRAAWTGIAHRSPNDAGLTAHDDLILTTAGAIPAWAIGAAGSRQGLWAVHVHGAGSTRAGTLRGVIAASKAGLPSLVATYRNSAEGPRSGRGRSHLGFTESRDIESALEHLVEGGAQRFVLFGWSMGTQALLPLAASDRWQSRVAGVVLDSPALDWMGTLRMNLGQARLPGALARGAASWIESPRRSRLVGIDEPIPLHRMDWVQRAGEIQAPVLIHHGTGDTSTPFSDSERFVEAAPEAQLVRTSAGHTVGWNVDPERWTRTTAGFLEAIG